jgi:tRNA(fMet)-specific endonuclease VapC
LKYLLDANIYRFAARQDRKAVYIAVKALQAIKDGLCTSSVVAFEIGKAIRNHKLTRLERDTLRAFLVLYPVIVFDADDAGEAAEIHAELSRSGRQVPTLDLMIAAQARRRGMVVATNNVKHFSPVRGLKVEDWTSP